MIKQLCTKLLIWWRWRALRRKLRTCGVYELQEGPCPVTSDDYRHEAAFVVPPTCAGGLPCSMKEKLGGQFRVWLLRTGMMKERTPLPGLQEVADAVEKMQEKPGAK